MTLSDVIEVQVDNLKNATVVARVLETRFGNLTTEDAMKLTQDILEALDKYGQARARIK